jgi:hypothetical protein
MELLLVEKEVCSRQSKIMAKKGVKFDQTIGS